MRVVFMGKSKRSAVRALDWLVARGVEVVAVVAPEPGRARPTSTSGSTSPRAAPRAAAGERGELYARSARGRGRRRLVPVLEPDPRAADLARPGRLPQLPPGAAARLPRRRAATTWPILEGLSSWGVSCHFVDERFDTGDLVEVERFPIDPERGDRVLARPQEPGAGCWRCSSACCERVLAGEELPRAPQGEGRYVTRAEFERAARGAPGRRPGAQAARVLVPALAGRGGGGGRAAADARRRGAAGRRGRRIPRRGPAAVAECDLRHIVRWPRRVLSADELRGVRHREPRRRALLHVLRRPARAPLPAAAARPRRRRPASA